MLSMIPPINKGMLTLCPPVAAVGAKAMFRRPTTSTIVDHDFLAFIDITFLKTSADD